MKIRIKICGLTNPEDIQSCYRAGADAIGINMIPSSPRYVPVQKIPQLCQDCPPFLSLVGLWPQQHFRQVTAQAYQLGISEIQWYGNWEEAVLSYPFRILFVLRLREENQLKSWFDHWQNGLNIGLRAAGVVVDSYTAGELGGSGIPAPWELLAKYRDQFRIPLILAGGLTPQNVAEAIRIVQPDGVDVASGVESSPGKKDPDKLNRFVDEVYKANR